MLKARAYPAFSHFFGSKNGQVFSLSEKSDQRKICQKFSELSIGMDRKKFFDTMGVKTLINHKKSTKKVTSLNFG